MSGSKEQPTIPRKKPRVMPEDVLAPPPCSKQEAAALQALSAGEANKGQQQIALDWIIYFACATYDEPYRSERPHDTTFASGRAAAGRNILRVLKLKVGQMEE